MLSRLLLSVLAAVLAPALAHAQDVVSGPDRDQAPPALKVFDATGSHQGKEIDFVTDRMGKPTVYVFIPANKWTRPLARFLRLLDAAVQKADAAVVAVWLTDDVAKKKAYLPVAQHRCNSRRPA